MQVSRENVIALICALTGLCLIVGLFISLFVGLYNQRKKKYSQEAALLKETYEKELVKTQMEVHERTLKTVAAEIHDNIGQLLGITKLTLTSIQPESDIVTVHPKVINSVSMLDIAIKELRQLALVLHADNLIAKGLKHAIETELSWLKKTESIEVCFEVTGQVIPVQHAQTDLFAFRIIQELLSNIVKHACANVIRIFFDYDSNAIRIKVTDDGKGFDVEAARKENAGIGMNTLFTRASLIGGTLILESEVGKGTTAILKIPYSY